MGCDPKAILYYGIKLDAEPEEYGGKDYMDVNELWQKENRPPKPNDPDYKSAAWDEWRVLLRAYEKTARHVEIDWSGTDGCHDDGWYVHCPAFEKKVAWDDQIDLGHPTLGKIDEADAALREFCEKFNLPYQQPTWHLAARYF